jgi:Skp family chaperone for outer membrane proteins
MIRFGVLAAGAAVVAGAAFVAGSSVPPKPLVGAAKPDEARVVVGQKTGYFNMARVMREYKRANSQVARVAERQKRSLATVKGLRDMHADLQRMAERASDPNEKYRIGREIVTVARLIEDFDREQGKAQHERAGEIITEVFKELRATTAEMARDNGLQVVLAFPAPVTPEEAENPMLMELMLKPPAAHPFYLDPSVDYTDDLIQRLNAKFAAEAGGH